MFVNYSMYKLLPILLFAYSLAVTTEEIYDNSYALIIGIDKYENVRSLDYAVKDAEDIQSMLVDKFNFQQDNIVLLKNEEATQASILQEFSNITKKANDNDRVLIFFAGHGETIDLPDGGEMGFLLPVDGDKTDLYLSAIKMEELRTLSLLSDAKHILYLVDACYGGIATVGARGLDAESTPNYLDKITKYKSRQIISAGGRGEEVIEKAEWGHSAFTKNLLSGLRDSKADTDSDGVITVQELGTYLQKKVTIDSDNRQTPKTRNLSTDEGEFVFVYSENTVVIQDKSTDAKLDYLISEMEELKTQSTVDKTSPDLMVNPNMKQSDYPLLFNWSTGEYMLTVSALQRVDKRTAFGLAYDYYKWEELTESGDYAVNTQTSLRPYMGYYLSSRNSKIFNPLILLSLYPSWTKVENQTQNPENSGFEINYSLELVNQMSLYNNFGFTFGYGVKYDAVQSFDEKGELYQDGYEFSHYPRWSVDIIIPQNTYGSLNNIGLDRINSLRKRKKLDRFGFYIFYGITILGHIMETGGIEQPVLLCPVIGPFLGALAWENAPFNRVLWSVGFLQTGFLIDYIRTEEKIHELNNNISYQINPNPIAPSVEFTYKIQQSDYPWSIDAVAAGKLVYVSARRQLNKRAFVGIGFGKNSWDNDEEVADEVGFAPQVGFYLNPFLPGDRNIFSSEKEYLSIKEKTFNPYILFSVSLNTEEHESKTLEVKDVGTEINYGLSINNSIEFHKNSGVTYGYYASFAGIQLFNEHGELYVDRHEFYHGLRLLFHYKIPVSKKKD